MMQNCPKCSRPARDPDLACARCGLLRSRWEIYQAQAAQPHPALDPLWQQALADWQDQKRHNALLLVAGRDFRDLSALAQRYSAVLRERPQDPIATAALDHLIKLAMQVPIPGRNGPGETGLQRGAKAMLGLAMMALAMYLMLLLFRR